MGYFVADYYSMCVYVGIAIVIEWKQAELRPNDYYIINYMSSIIFIN